MIYFIFLKINLKMNEKYSPGKINGRHLNSGNCRGHAIPRVEVHVYLVSGPSPIIGDHPGHTVSAVNDEVAHKLNYEYCDQRFEDWLLPYIGCKF